MLKNAKEFYSKHESKISSLVILLGFAVDSIMFTRIDIWYNNLILFLYLVIAAIGITLINSYKNKIPTWRFIDQILIFMPTVVQFAFGGLFSAFVILYGRSSSLFTSWPFIIVLLLLLFGNELFKKSYQRLGFQVSIFFVAIFSFLIFYLPIIFSKVSTAIFLLSGILSVLFLLIFIKIIKYTNKNTFNYLWRPVYVSIFIIYVSVNILYLKNIIPPIPLSLSDSGIYHDIVRKDGGYIGKEEKKKWYESLEWYEKIYIQKGTPVYFYSAVFSPTKLNTNIFHIWKYFDRKTNSWIITDKISLSIIGGRGGGYRGYSAKAKLSSGLWRVVVVNKKGQTLGRRTFMVIDTATPVSMEYKVL